MAPNAPNSGGSTGTWHYWMTGTTNVTTLNSPCYDPWLNWTASTSTTLNVNVWADWQRLNPPQAHYAPETAEQQTARLVRQAEIAADAERRRVLYEAQQVARRRREEGMVERAEALLQEVLDDYQKAERAEHGWLTVEAPGGNRYRVEARGQHGNVVRVDVDGLVQERLCIQPRGGLPNADAHVAQMLLLQTDEEEFRRIANITPVRRREPVAA